MKPLVPYDLRANYRENGSPRFNVMDVSSRAICRLDKLLAVNWDCEEELAELDLTAFMARNYRAVARIDGYGNESVLVYFLPIVDGEHVTHMRAFDVCEEAYYLLGTQEHSYSSWYGMFGRAIQVRRIDIVNTDIYWDRQEVMQKNFDRMSRTDVHQRRQRGRPRRDRSTLPQTIVPV